MRQRVDDENGTEYVISVRADQVEHALAVFREDVGPAKTFTSGESVDDSGGTAGPSDYRSEVADRLEGLLQMPLNDDSDVGPWIDACFEVQAWIAAHAGELPSLPAELMFYFHDPDIRVKDSEYKATQELAVLRFIEHLRGGKQPEVTRPWWRFW